MLKDLHFLLAIFNILADLCQEQSLYIEPFLALLKNCSKRFLLDRSTDTEVYSSVLVAFYSDFGKKTLSFYSNETHNILSSQ